MWPCELCLDVFPTEATRDNHACQNAGVVVESGEIQDQEEYDQQEYIQEETADDKIVTHIITISPEYLQAVQQAGIDTIAVSASHTDNVTITTPQYVNAPSTVNAEVLGLTPHYVTTNEGGSEVITVQLGEDVDSSTVANLIQVSTPNIIKAASATEADIVTIDSIPTRARGPRSDNEADRPHVCGYCKKTFRTLAHLKSHFLTHTGERNYVCSVCDKGFSLSSGLKRHMRIHTGEKRYACHLCSRRFNQIDHLKVHLTTHTGKKRYICKHCHDGFNELRHLKQHEATHSEDDTFTCPNCGSKYRDQHALNNHMKRYEESEKKAQGGEDDYPPGQHQCHYCDQTFERTSDRKRHMRKKHNEDKFKCPIQFCGSAFQNQTALDTHIKSHRTYKKPKKVYNMEGANKDGKFVCEVCSVAYTLKRSLTIHMRVHTGDRPYQCDFCTKTFTLKAYLTSHTRTHTGEKPFQCEQCFQQFSLKEVLRRHMRTHTDERPYVCSDCGKAFRQAYALQCHSAVHTGIKTHACEICGKGFARKNALIVHTRTHTGEKPYACPGCGVRFTENRDRKKHIKSHPSCNIEIINE